MAMRCVVSLIMVLTVCALLASDVEGRRRAHKVSKKRRMHTIVKDLEHNVTALWTEVKQLSQPVHVHLHDDGHVMEPPHHPHHHHDDNLQSSSSDDDDDAPDQASNDNDHNHNHPHANDRMMKKSHHHDAHGDKMQMMMKKRGHGEGEGEEEEEEEWEEKYLHKGPGGTHVHIHLHTGGEEEGMGLKRHPLRPQEYRYARCEMGANSALPVQERQDIRGTVFFRQMPGQPLEAKAILEGFELKHISESGRNHQHLRGLHGHEFGDLSDGCNSLGGHINPYGVEHGGPEAEHRHMGDFGNIEVQEDGRATRSFTDDVASLFGSDSMLGRSMVIHAGPDDHGKGHSASSKKSGNAGGRIACCIVVACSEPDGVWSGMENVGASPRRPHH